MSTIEKMGDMYLKDKITEQFRKSVDLFVEV